MEFLKILKQHSYYYDKLNIKKIKDNWTDLEIQDYLVNNLKKYDKHLYVIPKDILEKENNEFKFISPEYKISANNNSITITIPPLVGFLTDRYGIKYAKQIHLALYLAYKKGIKNINLNLVKNTGGDLRPMLLGINSLLPDDKILLNSIDNNNEIILTVYVQKNSIIAKTKNKKDVYTFNQEVPYFKFSNSEKIKIKISKYTASAGEMLVLCFNNIPNVSFVGEKIYGILTDIYSGFLKNGTHYGITNAMIADSNMKIYSYIDPSKNT